MGWFFGFKLHLICSEKGELLNFMITPGDMDDRKPLEYKAFVEFIYGKLVGDKGYIGKHLFERLFVDGIQLIGETQKQHEGGFNKSPCKGTQNSDAKRFYSTLFTKLSKKRILFKKYM